MPEKEPLFDVVIYNRETMEIDAIAGTHLKRSTGFHNADKRLEVMLHLLNINFGAAIVESGRYLKGDTLADGDGFHTPEE